MTGWIISWFGNWVLLHLIQSQMTKTWTREHWVWRFAVSGIISVAQKCEGQSFSVVSYHHDITWITVDLTITFKFQEGSGKEKRQSPRGQASQIFPFKGTFLKILLLSGQDGITQPPSCKEIGKYICLFFSAGYIATSSKSRKEERENSYWSKNWHSVPLLFI